MATLNGWIALSSEVCAVRALPMDAVLICACSGDARTKRPNAPAIAPMNRRIDWRSIMAISSVEPVGCVSLEHDARRNQTKQLGTHRLHDGIEQRILHRH